MTGFFQKGAWVEGYTHAQAMRPVHHAKKPPVYSAFCFFCTHAQAMRPGILTGYDARAFSCGGCSRTMLRWMPRAAATAKAVAELPRERRWKTQRWKTLEDPAMSLRRRWETQRMRERRTSRAVDRLGGEAQGQDDQPAARCMIELGSSSS